MTDTAMTDIADLIERSSLSEGALATRIAQTPRSRVVAVLARSRDALDNPKDGDLDAMALAGALGDRAAVGRVLELIRPLVVRYCRARISGDRSGVNAEDVAQEVCLAVVTALPRYQDQGRPFIAFVYGIAAHKVADAHRSHVRNRTTAMDDVPETFDPDDTPERRAIESDDRSQLAAILATLSEKHREILVLRLVVGLSAEETAAMMGSTAGAVRVAQHRALQQLRAQVKGATAAPGQRIAADAVNHSRVLQPPRGARRAAPG